MPSGNWEKTSTSSLMKAISAFFNTGNLRDVHNLSNLAGDFYDDRSNCSREWSQA